MESIPESGSIVRSTHGRDKDTVYAVLTVEIGPSGPVCLLANGAERKTDRPKRKNPRHLQLLCEEKAFAASESVTDETLRKKLEPYRIDL